VVALHWRGAGDEEAAEAALAEIAHSAADAGLAVHWGRKVLEVRPPVALDKGIGIAALFAHARGEGSGDGTDSEGVTNPGDGTDGAASAVGGTDLAALRIHTAIYVGDDRTDLDAFRRLRAMVSAGNLDSAVCVAVASDEGPSELVEQADLTLDGHAAVRQLLSALL
jgi:trehalose 6-phosphate phosphatase